MRIVKKAVAIILALVLSVGMVGTGNRIEKTVVAAENDTVIYEKMDISSYRETIYTAPYKEGYVFGGWYKGDNDMEPIGDKVTGGEAYAKFVPEEVLQVYCQNTDGTAKRTDKTNVRLVTSVDSTMYKKIGFDIEVYGTGKTQYNFETSVVYRKIVIASGSDAISINDSRHFSKASRYYVTVRMINIPNKGFDTPFLIKPYWITQDGTKVYGVDRVARVRNGYDGSFSVPVRVDNADKKIVAGLMNVEYDYKKLRFEGYDEGELLSDCIGQDNNGVIKILVSDNEVAQDVKAQGILVILNFIVRDYDTEEEQFNFKVTTAQFCDSYERLVKLGNIKLRSVNK